MVKGADCTRCTSRAYDQSRSISAQKGSYFHPENYVDDIVYAGYSLKDQICIGHLAIPCIYDFEFFVIVNDTS